MRVNLQGKKVRVELISNLCRRRQQPETVNCHIYTVGMPYIMFACTTRAPPFVSVYDGETMGSHCMGHLECT